MPINAVVNEKDQSLYVNSNVVSPVLAIIGTATKGIVGEPVLCSSQREFIDKFGRFNENSYGVYAAMWYLAQVSKLYYVRVAGDSAKKSKVDIKGESTSSTVITNLIELETNDVGTFYDGYVIEISNSAENKFDLKIKTSETGNVLYTFEDVSLVDTSPNYIGKVLKPTFLNVKTISDVTATTTNGVYTLVGGDNGFEEFDSAAITALKKLESSTYVLDLLTIPGVSSASVVAAGLTACETRGDTLYIVDPPASLDYEEVADWANGSGTFDDHTKFNSSHGTCYWGWQYIYDEVSKKEVLVPPSVVVAPAIARSEAISEPWFAPAGLTRGLVKNVIRSEYAPNDVEVNFLYEEPNSINSIITHEISGLVLWGQKTLWRNDTALNRINVRRLVTYIKRIVKRTCQYLLFEPNDSTTWIQFEDLLDPTFRSLVKNRGLYEYKIIPMKYTITPDDIDNSRMPAQILIKPTKSAEFIPIDIVITSTGVEFSNDVDRTYE